MKTEYIRVSSKDVEEKLVSIGFSRNVAREYSSMLMNLLGFSGEILDNELMESERSIFYDMEEYGILKRDTEEVLLKNRRWKILRWFLNSDRIMERGEDMDDGILGGYRPDIEMEAIYDNSPDEWWKRNSREIFK